MAAVSEPLASSSFDFSPYAGNDLEVRSPIDGSLLSSLRFDTPAEIEAKVARSVAAFRAWSQVPGPRRGELVRIFGQRLRAQKRELGRLVPGREREAARDPAVRIRTEAELKEAERRNLLRALEATGWRMEGANGAARLLGMNPSTLRSRLKALGATRGGRAEQAAEEAHLR